MRRLIVSPTLHAVRGEEGSLPLLPNRQAARSLGVPYRSLDGVAARIVEDEGLQVAPRLTARRLLELAVRLSTDSDDPGGLARAVEPTLRELNRAGVDPAELAEHRQPRIARLGRIGKSYRRLLRRDGLADQSELPWLAAASTGSRRKVVVSGFPRLPAAERALIQAIADEGSAVHLPLGPGMLFEENRRAASDFEAHGWNVEQRQEEEELLSLGAAAAAALLRPRPTRPGGAALAFPDMDTEARGILAAVKRLLSEGVRASEIAIVARDEQSYGPLLLAIAAEYRLPVRALFDVPLAQTRFGSWLTSLLEALLAGLPFESTARLLAHPLASAIGPADWSKVRKRRLEGGEWGEVVPALGQPWPGQARLAEYLRVLHQLLEQLSVRRNALRWPAEIIAFATLLEELRNLPERQRELTLEAFVAEIADLASTLTVPAAPGRGGVELHSPLSLFGARVEHLFVVGAAEGILPAAVRPDPLLDPFEREELASSGLAVETVSQAALREQLSFWALLHSAGSNLTLSHPRLLGRSEALPSPFLARLGLEPQALQQTVACSPQELRRGLLAARAAGPVDDRPPSDPVLERAAHALAVELHRESDGAADEYDGVTGIPFTPRHGIGVSRLIDLASCPFKFFGSTVLRLGEPEEAPEAVEPSLRGQLYHRVLQLAVQAASQGDVRAATLGELEAAFAVAEEEFGLTRLATWALERDQHLALLRRAVNGEEFLSEGAKVREFEVEFTAEWKGIPVRGRMDRIDAGREGLELLDYKSGSWVSQLAQNGQGRAKVDLQLPVYLAAAEGMYAGEKVARARYYSLSKAESIRVPEPDEGELERIAAKVREAWRDGAFAVAPDLDGSSCRYCSFDSLCRRGPRLERKRSAK